MKYSLVSLMTVMVLSLKKKHTHTQTDFSSHCIDSGYPSWFYSVSFRIFMQFLKQIFKQFSFQPHPRFTSTGTSTALLTHRRHYGINWVSSCFPSNCLKNLFSLSYNVICYGFILLLKFPTFLTQIFPFLFDFVDLI